MHKVPLRTLKDDELPEIKNKQKKNYKNNDEINNIISKYDEMDSNRIVGNIGHTGSVDMNFNGQSNQLKFVNPKFHQMHSKTGLLNVEDGMCFKV